MRKLFSGGTYMRRLLCFLVLLTALVFVAGCAGLSTPEELVQKGFESLDSGSFDQAESAANLALKKQPTCADAYIILAEVASKRGQGDQAADFSKKAAELAPDQAKLRKHAGMFALKAERWDDAYRLLAEFADKGDLAMTLGYADAAVKTNHAEEAVELVERIAANSSDTRAYTKLGELNYAAGFKRDAIEAYRKALELDPTNMIAANNLAYSYAENGEDLDRAKQLAEEAVASARTNPNYLDTLGYVRWKRGETKPAIQAFEQAVRIQPIPIRRAHFGMALAKEKIARPRAFREISFALREEPELAQDAEILAAAVDLGVTDSQGNLLAGTPIPKEPESAPSTTSP